MTGQTRLVELAYPRTIDGRGHEPDEVVELPADQAKRLVHDGRARWHTPPASPEPAPKTTSSGRSGGKKEA